MNVIHSAVQHAIIAAEARERPAEVRAAIAAEIENDLLRQLMAEPAGPLRRSIRGAGTGLPPRPRLGAPE